MTANTWFYIGIVSFVIAAAFAILSVILFFKLNIKEVLNDLTGKTAATGIQTLREETKTKERKRRRTAVNTVDEILTKSVNHVNLQGDETETTILSQGDETATTLLSQGDETATTLLSQGDEDATTLLSQGDESATQLLNIEEEKAVEISIDNTIIVHG